MEPNRRENGQGRRGVREQEISDAMVTSRDEKDRQAARETGRRRIRQVDTLNSRETTRNSLDSIPVSNCKPFDPTQDPRT